MNTRLTSLLNSGVRGLLTLADDVQYCKHRVKSGVGGLLTPAEDACASACTHVHLVLVYSLVDLVVVFTSQP